MSGEEKQAGENWTFRAFELKYPRPDACHACRKWMPKQMVPAIIDARHTWTCTDCNTQELRLVKYECENCRTEFDGLDGEPEKLCLDCHKRQKQCLMCKADFVPHKKAEWEQRTFCHVCQQRRRAMAFQETIGSIYNHTEVEKLPCPEAAQKVRDAINEFYGTEYKARSGIFMHGASGSGKTRIAYMVAAEGLEDGTTNGAIAIRGQNFQKEVWNRTKPGGTGDVDEWFESLCEAEMLIIDEVDKIRFRLADNRPSDITQSLFFELLERRVSARCLFTIFTSNVPADEMVQNLEPKYQDATLRRLREFFTPMKFTA